MTWNPRTNIIPVNGFRLNLVTFMREHMAEALVWAAAQCGLDGPPPTPAEYCLSLAVRAKRPVVNVLNGGADPGDNDDGGRDEAKRLVVEVERTASDSDELIKTLEPYTLAFTSMALEMDEEDWLVGIGTDDRGDFVVDVGKERYSGRTYENEKVFLQVGSIEVNIAYTQNRKEF